jgi:hypothetical protein
MRTLLFRKKPMLKFLKKKELNKLLKNKQNPWLRVKTKATMMMTGAMRTDRKFLTFICIFIL